MKRFLYLIVGFISLALGIIGVVLPVIPTTPFLLLTSFCFAKGSKRFYSWFINTKIYENHLKDFVTSRQMSLKTKIFTLGFASTMLLFPLFLVDHLWVKFLVIIMYITKYYYFIFKIKTI